MYTRKRFFKKYTTTIFFGSAIALSALFSLGDIMNKADGINTLRNEINEQQFNILRLQQNEEMLKAQSKIANSRMERGCVPVVDPNFETINGFKYFNLVTLQKGQPVRDRTNQTYLPAGTVVCGANGDTAELVLNDEGVPVAQNFAVGGSKALVEKNVQRFAGNTAKVFWNTPTVVN